MIEFIVENFWLLLLVIVLLYTKRHLWAATVIIMVQICFGDIKPWILIPVITIVAIMEIRSWANIYIADVKTKTRNSDQQKQVTRETIQ